MTALWLLPHHDGSSVYVPVATPELGGVVPLLLRAPRGSGVSRAWVRVIVDGEPELVEAVVDRRTGTDVWFRVQVAMVNPVLSYRWLVDGGRFGYRWVNQSGVHSRDVADAFDFTVTVFPKPAEWATDTMYQIFPDRFAKSIDRPAPDWALPAAWDDPVIGEGPDTPRQWYGGDLDGITAHLDHIASLGVGTLYLTPFFPAPSNHRYNATTFSHIDPLLGGDAAFDRLARAAHDRGMHLMGDLTTNHCGDQHEWFRTAVTDPTSPEAGFFFFSHHPDAYAAWWNIPEMPIFNHTSPELRTRLYQGPDSVVAHWMRHGLDAWRIDVANMTGKRGPIDVSHDVARTIRTTMTTINPDHFLQAESNHDASADLLGDGYQGTMNYAAFTRPLWQWLIPPQPHPLPHTKYPALPNLPGTHIAAAMRELSGVTPWNATLHAMNLIGSHDTHRIASLLPDPALVDVAFGMLATYPGVPMIYAGDELGLTALGPEHARIPMPWNHPTTWNTHRLTHTRTLFTTRATNPALRTGGLRWIHTGPDTLTYLREHPDHTILIHAARAPHPPITLPTTITGTNPTPLAGSPTLTPTPDHTTLPNHGPALSLWQL